MGPAAESASGPSRRRGCCRRAAAAGGLAESRMCATISHTQGNTTAVRGYVRACAWGSSEEEDFSASVIIWPRERGYARDAPTRVRIGQSKACRPPRSARPIVCVCVCVHFADPTLSLLHKHSASVVRVEKCANPNMARTRQQDLTSHLCHPILSDAIVASS
jgi:hypothetical protein